jgi:hypothetical protein
MRTVAHLAAAESKWDLLTYLVTKTRFNFDLKDRFGKTPFDEISDPEKLAEYQKLLRETRSDPNFEVSLRSLKDLLQHKEEDQLKSVDAIEETQSDHSSDGDEDLIGKVKKNKK